MFRRKREREDPWRGPLLGTALRILTPQKVVGAKQAASVWETDNPSKEVARIRYERDTLNECATRNKLQRGENWYLAYVHGFSLREQHERAEECSFKQSCFDSESFSAWEWVDSRAEAGWAEARLLAGYYLLDFGGRYENMEWREQEVAIAQVPTIARSPEAMVVDAAFMVKWLHKTYLMSEWYHWGPSETSDSWRVYVGKFCKKGFWVQRENPLNKDPNLRVVIYRKWDF